MPSLPSSAGDAVETGAGFLLGCILWAVAINWIRGGNKQALGWIRAKMINQPYGQKAKPLIPSAPLTPTGPI